MASSQGSKKRKSLKGRSSTKVCDKMDLARLNADRAEKAVKGEEYYVLVECDTPDCDNFGELVNAITGMKDADDVDAFMEGWDPEDDEADVCVICNKPGTAEGYGRDNPDE